MSDRPEDFQRISSIFDRAVELSGDERQSYLDEACGPDEPLRREVEELLSAADTQGPLDQPVESWAHSLAAEAGESFDESHPAKGRRVGPWEIVGPLGAGGMGRVFVAERAEGEFRQRCALKILRWEMASPNLIERFRMERQILADLEYSSIARLIDGGVTPDGLPFLAMELVEGKPIDEYCREKKLGLEQRLELFQGVVEAVQFAHRNLVVHRDLKPSNILVTTEGRIKLLDFGVAKLVDEAAGETLTRTNFAPASLLFAAPEQLQGGTITTATDVWALGTLLYLMLAERAPFEASDDTSVRLTQRILETEAPAMSSVAAAGRRLQGDLDNIVAKALEKDPARRYSSAERLGEDIARHLAGEPVSARPATLSYRLGKFVRRHRVSLGVAASVLAGVVSLVVFYTARLADERDRAQLEARKTEEVKDYLVSLFRSSDPSVAQGEETTARELLDRGSERLPEELSDQPEIKAEMHYLLGELYSELGVLDLALEHVQSSARMRRELDADHEGLGESLGLQGYLLQETGDYEQAEPVLREALETARRNPDDTYQLAYLSNQLGLFLSYKGDYEEAIALLEESIGLHDRMDDTHPGRLATSLGNLGLTLKWSGDSNAAEPYYRRAQSIRKEHLGENHPDYAGGLDNLGVLLGQRGDFEESEACFREALEIRRRVLGPQHPDVALNLNNLASLFMVQKRLDDAEPIYRQVIEINRGFFGNDHPRVATNVSNLGKILMSRGELEEASELLTEALRARRATLGDVHIDTAISLNQLSFVEARRGNYEASLRYSDEAVEVTRAATGDERSIQLGQMLTGKAGALLALDRHEEAVPVVEEALAIQTELLDSEHWEITASRSLLALARVGRQQYDDETHQQLKVAYEQLKEKRGPDDWYTARAREGLITLYRATGRAEEATTLESES